MQPSGIMAANQWIPSGDSWCYVNAGGAMVTGWNEIGGETYYMISSSGKCAIGWCTIQGKIYYFDKSAKMLRNTTVDGYRLGPDGVYVG